jgi:hypothetical protein
MFGSPLNWRLTPLTLKETIFHLLAARDRCAAREDLLRDVAALHRRVEHALVVALEECDQLAAGPDLPGDGVDRHRLHD